MFGQGYAAASRRYAAMDATAIAMRGGDRAKAFQKQTRALTLLHALETSLDFEQGGEIAMNLAIIYREARRRLLAAVAENDADKVLSARSIINDIAEAWAQIG
jgi:flagellar protein FliS